MNWQSLIKDFKNFLKFEKNLTENTIQSYVLDIKKLIDFIEYNYKNKKVDDFTNNDIKQFIYTQSKIIGTRSQSRLISSIKKFFHFLEIEKLIEENPTDELEYPKIGLKIPETLSTIEIDSLINYFKNSKNNSLRNSTITEVLYSCGVRVSELINIKISDIFFEDFLIKVNGKGNKERFVPMSKLSKIMIKDYISSERFNVIPKKGYQDFLFLNNRGQKLSRVMIFTILNIAKKRLGFEKNISPHLLRHSFATHLIENGADISSIQKMLGHSNITTTERYLHVSKKHLIETIKKYHPKKT